MQAPQLAGLATTVAVIVWVDLPVDWLVFSAMMAGAFATFAVSTYLQRRR
ncbi:MAG: hypothetical protein KBA31_11120 [Alphaproteobacteria bacterium]|nr:hypothetical protein [Alphaproteobacteria bacterium]